MSKRYTYSIKGKNDVTTYPVYCITNENEYILVATFIRLNAAKEYIKHMNLNKEK